jgi:hypothetical protein
LFFVVFKVLRCVRALNALRGPKELRDPRVRAANQTAKSGWTNASNLDRRVGDALINLIGGSTYS